MGNDLDKFFIVIEKVRRYFEFEGYNFMIKRVFKKMVDMFFVCKMEFKSIFERDFFDYVYKVEDLVNLKGKKYYVKKNYINKFLRLYLGRYEWKKVDEEIVRFCWDFECEWYEKRNGKEDIGFMFEKMVIERVIRNFDKFLYEGMVIFIDGEIKVFMFGEFLNKNIVVIYIEKVDLDVEGFYVFIN